MNRCWIWIDRSRGHDRRGTIAEEAVASYELMKQNGTGEVTFMDSVISAKDKLDAALNLLTKQVEQARLARDA